MPDARLLFVLRSVAFDAARFFHYGSSGTYLPVERKCGVATVNFRDATRVYPGADHPSVDKLNLEIGDGEFMVLVGPSGCGKSTSLRMLAGLEEINAGSIYIGDRDVTDLPPKDRDIAMVFQNYALYPHMTVGDNMGFALKMAGVPKTERQQRVQEAAHLLGLEDFPHRKPTALSRARPRGLSHPKAEGPRRGSGPGRRHGSRHRPLAAGLPHGRAAVEP